MINDKNMVEFLDQRKVNQFLIDIKYDFWSMEFRIETSRTLSLETEGFLVILDRWVPKSVPFPVTARIYWRPVSGLGIDYGIFEYSSIYIRYVSIRNVIIAYFENENKFRI